MAGDTSRFLAAFLAGKPQNMYAYVWTFPDKQSMYFQSVGIAENYIRECADKKLNVFIGMGLSSKAQDPSKRTQAKDVQGITGCWLDIDYGEAGHKKAEKIPPDRDSALALLSELPEPSILVDSGGGLHAYWLFQQPWIFEGDADRNMAASFLEDWNGTLIYYASLAGYEADSVHDLARVLRVPGTQNHKTETPRDCVILKINDHRYNPFIELPSYIKEKPKTTKTKSPRATDKPSDQPSSGVLDLSENAQPPFDKFQELQGRPKFKKTWEGKRTDLNDSSDSGYEMALANFAIDAGWTDQETCDLLIAWRRKHARVDILKNGEPYFLRTIRTAHAAHNDPADDLGGLMDAEESEETSDQIRLVLRTLFGGVTITRLIKYDIKKPVYLLETDRGNASIGDVANLIGQQQFRCCMANAARVCIPEFPKARWVKIASLLLRIVEVEEIEEATANGHMLQLMREYLSDNPPANDTNDDRNDAYHQRKPATRNGVIEIQVSDFSKWINLHHKSEKCEENQLCVDLTTFGAQRITRRVVVTGEKPTTRSVWMLPDFVTREDEGTE